MAKKIVILMLLISCLAVSFVFAASNGDISKIKVVDKELQRGENISLILGPGSPYSIRLYEGTVVEFEVDGFTHKAIFEKLGDEAVIKYTLDAGKTYKEQKIKLGEYVKWNITTGSWFVSLYYKMQNEREKNSVFEIVVPMIQRSEIPIKMDKNATVNENKNKDIEVPPIADNGNNNKYIRYLIGTIIVLILVIIILGPRKKDEDETEPSKKEDVKEEEEDSEEIKEEKKTVSKKKPVKKTVQKKAQKTEEEEPTDKTYYTKPKKKPFNEEDVYVVKSSDDE